MSFCSLSTRLRVVKPFSGPNWSLQPLPTVYLPQALPAESVWLAGLAPALTTKEQGVLAAPARCVLIVKDQVQLVSAASHTRWKASRVHCGTSATADLEAVAGVGAARVVVVVRRVLRRRVVNCILAVVVVVLGVSKRLLVLMIIGYVGNTVANDVDDDNDE